MIVLPDLQIPYHDTIAVNAVEQYISDHKWHVWLQLGDLIDLDELSRFSEGKPGATESKADASFKAGRTFLERHRKLVGPACKMVVLEGNHEHRATSYTEIHPELGSVLNVPRNLALRELDIKWVPFWSKGALYEKGNAYFGHGRYCSVYHAARHAREYGVCFYYGHTHDVQEHTLVREATGDTIEAASFGCLCRYDQKYVQGAPTKWQQAFGVFHFLPDGYYNRYTVRIFKGRFVSPEGKVYQGRS